MLSLKQGREDHTHRVEPGLNSQALRVGSSFQFTFALMQVSESKS